MKIKEAILPLDYRNYVFDLYGTLVDIHTDESRPALWEKLSMFYGYYRAVYKPDELKAAYERLVKSSEASLKKDLETDKKYDAHEASPEIEITEVFRELFKEKGVEASDELAIHAGQFFRVLSTEYIKLYPGTAEMLKGLKDEGKMIYLLSNAQRIFTEFEMHTLDIFKYFDAVLISSDYRTRKPDRRFFDSLIREQKIDVTESLFIGNDSRNDIGGAQAAGFHTFYVGSNISPQNDDGSFADFCVEDFIKWI